MYSASEDMEQYLKFVYPERISIERKLDSTAPKFFTFMSTDGNGINCYFHSLIYWEQFTLHDIKKDYDVDLIDFGKKRTKRQSKIISMSVDSFKIPEEPQPQDKDEYFSVC